MKKCPQCNRDYNDDSLSFCLDDGAELLFGPAISEAVNGAMASDQPTAILHEHCAGEDDLTRSFPTDQGPVSVKPIVSADPRSLQGKSPGWLRTGILFGTVLLLATGAYFVYRTLYSGSGQINSIAVLPFTNAAGDKETDFLADGIAETLINNFTKIPELKVTARSTAFRYRGREGEPLEIGRELNVGSVLTGKLMQRGDQLTVQVDLINTSDGSQVWGDRYEGKPADIVSIQQRIATDVSSQLKLKLTGTQAQQIAKTYTQNPEAYQHYLRGRFLWNTRTAENLIKGTQEFQAAADLDPNYALAYVGLADSYLLMDEYAAVSSAETLPKARAFAERALQLDGMLGEAHATLGLVYRYAWRWDEAQKEFDRAIELNPNYPTARHWYSIMLRDSGRLDQALTQISRAQELDPLSGIIGINLGSVYIAKGDTDSAVATLQKTIDLNSTWWGGYNWLGMAHLKAGRNDEAVKSFEKSVELNRAPVTLGNLAYAYAVTGKKDKALQILNDLQHGYSSGQKNAFQIAIVYAGLGDREQTFKWLETSYQDRNSLSPLMRWFPQFETLKADPRLKDLIKRMNLPE